MNLILFSRSGIHIDATKKGEAIALFVPNRELTKVFTDIQNPSTASVKARMALENNETPLWRLEGSRVVVYGIIRPELTERRNALQVFLPMDFIPEGYNVFYLLFDSRWLIHGARIVNDDGVAEWHISRIDAKGEGVVDLIAGAISDRMMTGAREKIFVATHNSQDIEEDLTTALKALGMGIEAFDDLKRPKVKPLYRHKDFGLLMLTAVFCSLIVLAASIGFYVQSQIRLTNIQDEIVSIQAEIRRMQTQFKLGHIKNPDQMLRIISQREGLPPSSLIQEAGEVTDMFGKVLNIQYVGVPESGNNLIGPQNRGRSNIMRTQAEVNDGALLVDQERVAKSVIRDRSWVRRLERVASPRETQIDLLIEFKTEAEKE